MQANASALREFPGSAARTDTPAHVCVLEPSHPALIALPVGCAASEKDSGAGELPAPI
jgi:hypothetical protein